MITLTDLLTDNIDTGDAMRPYYKVSKDDLIKIKADIVTLLNDNQSLGTSFHFEDFISGNTTSGSVGKYNWYWTNGSVGLGGLGEARPGGITRTSSTTASVICPVNLGGAAGPNVFSLVDIEQVQVNFKLAQTTNTIFGIFISVNSTLLASNASNDYVGLYFNTAVDGNFNAYINNQGTTESQSMGAANTDWNKLKISKSTGGYWNINLNGTTYEIGESGGVELESTNIYTLGFHIATLSAGVTKTAFVDWCMWKFEDDTRSNAIFL